MSSDKVFNNVYIGDEFENAIPFHSFGKMELSSENISLLSNLPQLILKPNILDSVVIIKKNDSLELHKFKSFVIFLQFLKLNEDNQEIVKCINLTEEQKDRLIEIYVREKSRGYYSF